MLVPELISSSAGGTAQGEEDRSMHGAPAGGGGGSSSSQFPPGADDSLASLLPSAAELGLSMAEERPNARKCVFLVSACLMSRVLYHKPPCISRCFVH